MFSYSELDFKLAERFTGLVLGTDAYYCGLPRPAGEESLRNEGLVPVDFSGVAPLPVHSWQEALDGLTEVYQAYAAEQNAVRRNYMWQQIASFITICRWQSGEPTLYRQLVRESMFIDENPVTPVLENYYLRMMDAALTEKGYHGGLRQKLHTWQAERVVRGKQAIEELLRRQLAESQERTVALGFAVAADYQVTPTVVYDVPYNAYCDFLGRAIYISGDVEYTEDELKHLVCHEAFPGHMTHLAVRRELLQQGKVPADAGLVLTNTASSPVFEGIADNGMDFIGWRESVDDRICYASQALRAISGLNAAHLLHAENKSVDEVTAYLLEHGFGSESWAKARIRFISFPFRRPFIYSYWRGWEGVSNVWQRVPAESRPAFLSYLYRNMHSIDTVGQFADVLIKM